jgi:hypothetical protein
MICRQRSELKELFIAVPTLLQSRSFLRSSAMRTRTSSGRLSGPDLEQFVAACKAIGDQAAEGSGFVPIRALLTQFNADLRLRPLLVEAMLAFIPPRQDGESSVSWAVFVDSETFGEISTEQLRDESFDRPLNVRFRNTIAHELVHALAFRASDKGVRLHRKLDTSEDMKSIVQALEQETERLSPLLLLPSKSLDTWLTSVKKPLQADDIAPLCARFGVSRQLFIRRLSLLRSFEETSYLMHTALRNVAIGIGEWTSETSGVLKGWPLFINFDRGVSPSFLPLLSRQDRVPSQQVIPNASFALNGGDQFSVDVIVSSGVDGRSNAKPMKVNCSLSKGKRVKGAPFVFVVRGSDEP